ncbi:uncharacterized protein LOC129713025 [Leucoraja erinacea]|uniref:uncharacterized protein LOC129713025 n=1 Tax=Leucoraja erinaceus TaxID=7782 RepID=UPI0024590DD6|nr:uncharacterized protein LOC129713025 [Leucoraja erinacea]
MFTNSPDYFHALLTSKKLQFHLLPVFLCILCSAVEGAARSPQPAREDSQRQRQREDPTRNRYAGQKPINPERLKDFGEDEYVGKDVKTWELTVTGHSETLLNTGQDVAAYKASRSPEPCTRQAPFEDIRTAAFKIQHGILKTPCTVCGTFYSCVLGSSIDIHEFKTHSSTHGFLLKIVTLSDVKSFLSGSAAKDRSWASLPPGRVASTNSISFNIGQVQESHCTTNVLHTIQDA